VADGHCPSTGQNREGERRERKVRIQIKFSQNFEQKLEKL
jgi:hypothetical protein